MYEPSSNFYSTVVQNQTRRISWSGTITADGTSYSFTADNIVANSGQIINEISGSSMEIGTVYSSELDFDIFIDDIGVPRDEIYGAIITLNCTMTANGTTGTVPMGVFRVVEATQSGEICSITAYDNMSLFNEEFPITSGQATPYEWLIQLCNDCGVTLANTKAEIEALPNGSYRLGMTWDDDSNTYRDVIGQLAATLGCSAHMDRSGSLEFLPLTYKASIATLDAGDRFGSDIAHTQWTPSTFRVTNKSSGSVTSAGSGQLAFDLGDNAFLQQRGESFDEVTLNVTERHSVSDMLGNILTNANTLTVVPIEADIPLDPCLDLYDVVTLTGGQASNTMVLITSLIHTIGSGTEIKCAGANKAEESTTSTRGTDSSREDWLWVSGEISDGAKYIFTTEQNWQDQLSKTWDDLTSSSWGDLYSGGGWIPLEYFEVKFTQELTIGVIGLTTEYYCTKDVDARFKIVIETYVYDDDDNLTVETVSSWTCSEHAVKGTHTTTLVSPFGILDRDEDTTYRVTAYAAGVDVAESATFLTKEEIEALISGGESE